MKAAHQMMTRTCGVSLFNYFGLYEGTKIKDLPLGGANLGCAGFVNTPECRQAYEELKERFNVVYQSSPRRNSNSGRQFFFVVYDGEKSPKGTVHYNR